jgi:hypothetical protein
MPMTDTTTQQRPMDVISPTMGRYNYTLTWALDSTTLLPVGIKHEITIPPTTLPGE